MSLMQKWKKTGSPAKEEEAKGAGDIEIAAPAAAAADENIWAGTAAGADEAAEATASTPPPVIKVEKPGKKAKSPSPTKGECACSGLTGLGSGVTS